MTCPLDNGSVLKVVFRPRNSTHAVKVGQVNP